MSVSTDGDLNDKDNVAWQEADTHNRLARAAKSVAARYTSEYRVLERYSPIVPESDGNSI